MPLVPLGQHGSRAVARDIQLQRKTASRSTRDPRGTTKTRRPWLRICSASWTAVPRIGASFCTAKDAYLKFLRMNKLCVLNEDWHSQLLQARNAGAEDLAIVISYSGKTEEIITCMKALKENHVPTIAITRLANTPVAQLADEMLFTAARETLFRSGAMSSRISQLNIIDILYTYLGNLEYSRTLDQLSRTHIHKPGEDGNSFAG
mgnify:CR=1 FL=1